MGLCLLLRSGSHVLQNQIWAGQRPRPQNESRDHPRCRGQRSGFQVESRDHFRFVIRGQDPEMSKDQPFVGSGQDPRVKFAPISHLTPKPSCGQQGSLEPQQGLRRQVPGNRGLNQGGEGHYAIPGAPARIEAMPWARAGVVVRRNQGGPQPHSPPAEPAFSLSAQP
ncbi:hypothetical protein Celaphus_00006710 [Cervus elaphus hippelaphus]|uniref:Uncharacterized protein n=1 Tax=Cervus elaphus hippelaphus TaxID=46360 RepID=A0A212CZH5_CEREH|nr:hypothetical protein Celaphus_00006710 [Cervus elaphus hippelaphus]